MVRVLDIWTEACKLIGNSDDTFRFRRITDAVELLANKGDWDPLLGTLDIWVTDQHVTLPPEVETILGCNMDGNPSISRDELFQFHINGPGSHSWSPVIRWEWTDLQDSCIYAPLQSPSQVVAYCVDAADVNSELWVYGLDQNQNIVRTQLSDGTFRDGYQVPVTLNVTALPANAPIFSQITAVQKQPTAGPIRLSTVGETILGIYQSHETNPKYRRIRLSRPVEWVRIRFRRRTFNIQSKYDLIPLHSAQAVLMMLRALKAYDSSGGLSEAEGFEATALRWLSEEQFTNNPPVVHPIQVLQSGALLDSFDFME